MTEELNKQVEAGAGAVPEGTGAAGATSGGATTEGTGAPDVEAQINAAVEAAIQKYEGKGGHLARLRSSYDTKIADLQRQLQHQNKSRTDEALKLADTDPAKAVQLLAGIVQAQAEEAQHGQKGQEIARWQRTIMEPLGYDLDGDEEAARAAAEWARKIDQDGNHSWDFIQQAGINAVEREKSRADKAEKELQALKEGLDDTIQAAVTRILAGSGIIPEPSPDGAPPSRDENWREKPAAALIKDGLAARMKNAKPRT